MFQKFDYSKDWRNPSDFPTVEADETQVRADTQLLFTEARNAVWALVEALADQSAAANIGAEDGGKTVTLQSLLEALRSDEHSHKNLSGLEDLVTAFAGLTLATSITNDDTKIPTSKAIYDYVVKIGGGDMMTAIYDPAGKTKDIFAFAEEVTAEHTNKKDNPHGVTAEQLGLGNVDNTSDADKPVSTAAKKELDKKVNATDVIPIGNGGTGATTVAAARNALGLGNTSGAVPIANGGTGADTVAAARKNLGLGNTSGAVPIANGGTNATTAAEARTNLGITPAAIGALPTTGGVISGDLAVAGRMTLGAISNPTSVLKTLLNPTNFGYITDFNTGNAAVPGLWRVYNADGTAANAPYSGSVSGICLVVVIYNSDGTVDKAHQLFLDGLGDVYYKVYNNGVSYGAWKKLT